MDIVCEEREDAACFRLAGRLDAEAAPEAERQVRRALEAGKQRLLFDVSRLDYISSAGLRVLLMALKALAPAGGRVVLCGPAPHVREIFEVSRFSTVMPIADTVEAGWLLLR